MGLASIGRFKVGRKLGSGNQGTVYLCGDPELQRRVAIKLLDKTVLGSQEAAASFHREARSMSKIQHPNIVSIYEAGRQDGVPYLVFEFVEGRLLSEVIKGGELDVARTLELFSGMLEGIDRAHRQGIVHRDLKPSNIIISDEGMPKIMDFGIARVLSGQRDRDTQLIGSPRYMAPEYIERGEVGTAADVFALGLILDEMLTGMPVFSGSQQAVLESIINDEVPPPSGFNQSVDERLDRIVLKALEKDPGARYGSAGEFLKVLADYSKVDGDEGGVNESGKGTIEFLLRRMQRKSDFPALSQSVRTLNAMASTSDKDVNDMAKVIVKDFALTNKILKVVNSAYFGHFSGKIGTITRAVVVLGMQPIRSLAASLIFFEHLHDKAQAESLRSQTAASLYSAVLAGHVAAERDPQHREEHFLSAMLHHLGRMLVAYYLPDEAREIERLVGQQGTDELKAQRSVLGTSYEDVGISIAKQWNFPPDVTQSLKALPPDAEVEPPEDLDQSRRAVAGFANDMAEWLGGDADDTSTRRALLSRYGKALDMDAKKMSSLMASATREYLKLVENISAGGKRDLFVSRLKDRIDASRKRKQTGQTASAGDISATTQPVTAKVPGMAGASQVLDDAPMSAGDSETLLTEGLQEVTNILLNEPTLPELCNIVLETMYRAMAFQRVVLCLRDMSGGQMTAKIGFGGDVESYLKNFHFPLAWQADVFHAAVKNGVDVYISDAREAKTQTDLPDWYRRISDAGSFVIFPLVVKKQPMGLIYGDHPLKDGLQINGKTLNLLKTLRNQIVLGFRERM